MAKSARWVIRLAIALVIAASLAVLAWYELKPSGLGEGFAAGNGRIEATEGEVTAGRSGW